MGQLAAHAEHDVKLEALPGEKLKEAYSFWLQAKGDAELPPQSEIAPEKLPRSMLANFSIVTIENAVFRYRLIGSLVTRAWGEDITGRAVTEVNHGEEMAERMAMCVTSRRPYYSQGPLKFAVYDFRSFRVLVMPFAGAHNEVSRLLVYNEFC